MWTESNPHNIKNYHKKRCDFTYYAKLPTQMGATKMALGHGATGINCL